jgi:hypothetical protein
LIVKKANLTWTVKTDDAFPYSDTAGWLPSSYWPNSYWTGFYTSRATDKLYVRDLSNQYHSYSQLSALKAIHRGTTEQEI